ncbi:hypothetical protein ZIOFF_048523 [Zingiber officinale]|uniref:Homeobox-leucine zipper protein n=2 Tax=Zingiber officinale TaxID=94328 RepID=A0A8J5KMS1_ZINOF|nr:hypothetical protein ZIOFF_048523 [Zingiber officinale]
MEEQRRFSSLSELCSQTPAASTVGEGSRRRRRPRRKRSSENDEAKKRRLSDVQVKFLEMSFQKERKLESGRKVHLAAELGLDPKQVAVWFQNRRARHKNKQVEEAYAELKSAHDAVVLQKCLLESQVLNLREQLFEAKEEKRKLSLGINGGASGLSNVTAAGGGSSSPSSSFSVVGELGLEGGEGDFVYAHQQEHDFNKYMMEWANFYGV